MSPRIGIARSNAYEAPKPLEFGQTGAYWEQIGWRVDVGFIELRRAIRPSEYMDVLAPLLPSKYAPLRFRGTYPVCSGVSLFAFSMTFPRKHRALGLGWLTP